MVFEDLGYFQEIIPGYVPQVIMFNDPEKCNCRQILWYPGNCVYSNFPQRVMQVGYTGRYYKSWFKPQHKQDFYISWAGIDIDDYTNYEKILDIVGHNVCSIRLSKSGTGLHLFFRFKKPVHCKAGTKGSIVKTSLQPYVDQLKEAGLGEHVCKYDGNVFFVWTAGCAQTWLYQIKETIDFVEKQEIVGRSALDFVGGSEVSQETYEIKVVAKKLFKKVSHLILCEVKGVTLPPYIEYFVGCGVKHNTYIKHWYDALAHSQWAFETKSPMKTTEPHTNGFFIIDNQGYLKLWGAADNKFLFSYKLGV